MHFSRKLDEGVSPTIFHDGHPKTAPDAIRWLGIHLDRTLSYKYHIEKRAAAGRSIAKHIRGLSKVYKGLPPTFAHKAIHKIVLPRLLFSNELWWLGHIRPSARQILCTRPQVSNRLSDQIAKLQVALNTANRRYLPI